MIHRYNPPDGYYDLPFSWVYDANSLTDGQDYLNQFVYLQGGFGDFVLRRVVGLSNVLLSPNGLPGLQGGQYRLYDRYGTPRSAAPVFVPGAPTVSYLDKGIAPEMFFKETGKIAFDLYSVGKINAANAQIAFQGVRRIKGSLPQRPGFKATPKSFIYQQTVTIPTDFTDPSPILMRQTIKDYDFELHDIRLLQQPGSQAQGGEEGTATIIFTALPGVTAFDVDVTITLGPANTPFSLVATPGVSIVVVGATDAGGNSITSGNDLLAAFNADPVASSMASLQVIEGQFLIPNIAPPVTIGGAAFGTIPMTSSVAFLWIRDSNRVAIASRPMLDVYCDGSPASLGDSRFGNGAIVPPLYYPKDSLLQIDVSSAIFNFTQPVTLLIQMVGKQMIPC